MSAKFDEDAHNDLVISIYHVHKVISIHVHCDLELCPLISKINRVHPLTMVYMSAKFDGDAHISLVSIGFTGSKRNAHMDMEPQQHYYIPSAMCSTELMNPCQVERTTMGLSTGTNTPTPPFVIS